MKKLFSVIVLIAMICQGGVMTNYGSAVDEKTGFESNLGKISYSNGVWEETEDGLRGSGDGDCFAVFDAGVRDFVFETKVTFKKAGAASLVFRSNNNGSQSYVANVDLNRGDARIFKFPAVGDFEFGSCPIDKSVKEYTLRVEMCGGDMKYYVNGNLAVSASDLMYRSGKLGLLVYSGDCVFEKATYEEIEETDRPCLTGLEAVGLQGAIYYESSLTDIHCRVPADVESISLLPGAERAESITLSAPGIPGTEIKSGEASPEISLSKGINEIKIKLSGNCGKALSGKLEKTYTLHIGRPEKDEEVPSGNYLTYADVVSRLTDLSLLAKPVQDGERSAESTSCDRRSRYDETSGKYINWDANDDWGTSLDRTPDGGYILADVKGPGALVRIWSAQPEKGRVKIFIDGSDTPALDMRFADYFGSAFPFSLESITYDAARGKDCYLPITYNQSCKVVAYGDWGRYFHIGYINFADGISVEPFALPLSADSVRALLEADRETGGCGQVSPDKKLTVKAGGSAILFEDSGAGAVTGIDIKITVPDEPGSDWKALSGLTVSCFWDGENEPSVWTTLGGFFGSECGINDYNSLPLGTVDGVLYARWYMPYSNGAKIVVGSDADADYEIEYRVVSEKLTASEADDLLRFHAKWYRLVDPDRKSDRWPDCEFLSLTGSGRFVGTSLHVYKEYGVGDPNYGSDWWWGEGDEKFFVDGEKFPSWFGTGSEDYFGYAWGSWYPFSRAYHAQPFSNGGMFGIGNRQNVRFHITDNIPFTESFSACLEKYHRDRYSNMAVTNYFYLEKGAADGYSPASLDERTKYYDLPYPEPSLFYEGEELKIIECTGMQRAETQDMRVFGKDWSGNSQLIFKAARYDYLKLYINLPESGRYDLTAFFTKAGDFGIAEHYIDGIAVGSPVDLYNNGVIRSKNTKIASGLELAAGLHILEVRINDKNKRSSGYFYGLDCLELVKVGDLETGDPVETGTAAPPPVDPVITDPQTETPETGDSRPEDQKPGPLSSGAVAGIAAGAAVAAAAAVSTVLIINRKKKNNK